MTQFVAIVRRAVQPLLEECGFAFGTTKTAWRYSEKRIDVFSIETFPAAKLLKWNLPPRSFALAAGCFFPFTPCFFSPSVKSDNQGRLMPAYTECHIRFTPYKLLHQSSSAHRNIWSLDGTEGERDGVLADVVQTVSTAIVPWFERCHPLDQVLKFLEVSDETENAYGKTWGFGRIGSPLRHALTGFVALECGDFYTARHHLSMALAKGTLAHLSGRADFDDILRAALSRAEDGLQ